MPPGASSFVLRWSLPPAPDANSSTDGLGGGIAFAYEVGFCERMRSQFEESNFLNCADIRGGVERAFDTWSANHDGITFVDVTTLCEADVAVTRCVSEGRDTCMARCELVELVVAIAELYYDKLGAYMTALFELTKGEIERSIGAEGEEEVGQQAVEFWVTVCDEELDLIEEEQEAQEEGGAAAVAALERKCQHYAKHAAPTLLPLLLRGLTKKADVDEDDDDDEWTLAKSAATCLERMARTVDDAVVPPVLQFMQVGVQSQDWRAREAAILAFGSVSAAARAAAAAPRPPSRRPLTPFPRPRSDRAPAHELVRRPVAQLALALAVPRLAAAGAAAVAGLGALGGVAVVELAVEHADDVGVALGLGDGERRRAGGDVGR